MSEININIQSEVARHRVPTSMAFALGGRQFCKPEAVVCVKNFDQKVEDNSRLGNIEILPCRAPRRFRVKTFDVLKAEAKFVREQPGVLLNEGMEGGAEVFLPFDQANGQFGKFTSDAFEKALRGEDPNIVFADIKSAVEEANNYNRDEIARIERAIAMLNDSKQKITSAIAENNTKAKTYLQELADSRVETTEVPAAASASGTTSIVVHEE